MIIRGTSRSSVARFLIRISHTHTHTPAQNRRRVAHGCALDFRRAGQMKWLPPSNQCCVAAAVRSYTKCRCRRCVRLLIIFFRPFLLAFQCDVSRVSGECRSLFLSFFHSCHCIRRFVCCGSYLQAMCCAADRRAHTSQATVHVCVLDETDVIIRQSRRQPTMMRTESRPAKCILSLAEKSLCDASHFIAMRTHSHSEAADECGKRSHKRMDFFESHSLTAIICS